MLRGARVGAMIPAMRAAASGLSVRRWRAFVCPLMIAWLVVILAIATLETGLHSVHHIDDNDIAACVIAGAGAHVPIAEAPPIVSAPVADSIRLAAIGVASSEPSTRPLGVQQGRAPPPPPSA
jgi:hypothetical protein